MSENPRKYNLSKLYSSLKDSADFPEVKELLQDFFRVNVNFKVFGQSLSALDEPEEYIFALQEKFDTPAQLVTGKSVSNSIKTIFPLFVGKRLSAVCEVYSSEEEVLYAFSEITPVLEIKLENLLLIKKMRKDCEFQTAMNGISKIIETQYEYDFIIPIIGEVLDKFVDNHLVYIFLKDSDKTELVWPKSCLDTEIMTTISRGLGSLKTTKVSDSGKISYTPLISETKTIGYIVTKSTAKPLTQTEKYYLQHLSNRVASTITRAKVYSEILEYATLDALTNFYNRRQLDERLKQETSVANRRNSPLCAIMTDIDFFKKVNDTYGHACGDLVLKEVSKVMRSQLREYDIAGRFGGEEFVFLLPGTAKAEACMVAERLRDAVRQTVIDITKVSPNNSVKSISVTISIGVSEYSDNLSPEEFIIKADKALYLAKTSGRNTIKIL